MWGRSGVSAALCSGDAAALTKLTSLPPSVSILSLRADLAGDIGAAQLRAKCKCRLLYSLRSAACGGASDNSEGTRHARLIAVAKEFDLVELEWERDLVPQVLGAIEPARRLVSWRGAATDAASLGTMFAAMAQVQAAIYLLESRARRFVETIAPLQFLSALGRRDVVAYDGGPAGFWTRLIAPRLGAPIVFFDGDEAAHATDIAAVAALIDDYGLPALPRIRTLYGIVGRLVLRSRSPQLHNARYRADGRAALFLPFPAADFDEVHDALTAKVEFARCGLALRGLTVTSPFKEAALAFASSRSPAALTAGAANLLVDRDGIWHADTTDPEGVMDALARRQVPVRGARTAVIGCGGAGRAAAAALSAAGARVTLVNRSISNGRAAAARLGLPFVPLARLRPAEYTLVINATPVGSDGAGTVVDMHALDAAAVVVDFAYGRAVTPLVAGARARGLTTIDGFDVLSHQVEHQYARMAETEEAPARSRRARGGRRSRRITPIRTYETPAVSGLESHQESGHGSAANSR
jgi:3-dehydroquinate dehydratase / shikimate dehydrogenase